MDKNEILVGLNTELHEYKSLYKRGCVLLSIKPDEMPNSVNFKTAKEILNRYKQYLYLIQDKLKELDNYESNRLYKDIADSVDGRYSYLDKVEE